MTTSSELNIIHFTDTHIQPVGAEPLMNADTAQKMRDAIAAVQQFGVTPAFIVISGDLCHEADVAGYIHLKNFVDELHSGYSVPVFLSLGNHDRRLPFRKVFLDEDETDENKPYYFSQMVGDLRVIVLDTKMPNYGVQGVLDEAQLSWLAEQLAEPVPDGNLLIMHHPPVSNAFPPLAGHLLTNADALGDVIAGKPIVGILSGHIHFTSLATFRGILSVTGTGVAFTLDPYAKGGMRLVDGSGFNHIIIREGEMIVTPYIMPREPRELHFFRFEQAAAHTQH